ncbi:MAG: cyclic nucleotide-binding domain-containing protein [Defluviitaleaceae bacterium]|nr:cyclic nucleotide-binding domain-containing protein [Defluviitaleaceae bacterium]
MALKEYKQGDVLCAAGQKAQTLYFVTKGNVKGSFLGRTFNFGQGDAIGLCALSGGNYAMTYTAASDDLVVFPYPCCCLGDAEKPLKTSADLMWKTVNSLGKQNSQILSLRSRLKNEAQKAYEFLTTAYAEYKRLCNTYSFSAKQLMGVDLMSSPSDGDTMEDWKQNYYHEILKLDSNLQRDFFAPSGISWGFLQIGVGHLEKILKSAEGYYGYLQGIAKVYIDVTGLDLLGFVMELHKNSIHLRGADEAVGTLVKQIAELLQNTTGVDQNLLKERVGDFSKNLAKPISDEEMQDAPATDGSSGVKANLKDSLYTILEYAGVDEEEINKFARNIHEFTSVRDRTSSENDVYRLRRELTNDFYTVYTSVLIKSLEDKQLPTVIKMFLNFGYMDADLAGHDNADYLYSIADSYKGDPQNGVYTITEWLSAIYKGEKEPSQGDLDMDFALYVKEALQSRRLDQVEYEKEEKRMMADNGEKLRFELENVFPIGNKITFGRISSYCPVFGDHNVQRNLPGALVTAQRVSETLKEITDLDFSAFYREIMYSNQELEINSAQTSIEHMPNFILMPNVGTRGAMWQEIEGRNRNTKARVFLPAFMLEDLRNIMMRLTGEFRWEICKRTQGARWSDASYPSLTSEYFTYLQFYRGNRDLSVDSKASVKTELMRARNVYRAVFVNNYIDWLMYESGGSQRLNKVARRIMMMYCPFPAEHRQKLGQNPQYADPVKQYELAKGKDVQKLSNTMQKVKQLNKPIPQELLDEVAFLEK